MSYVGKNHETQYVLYVLYIISYNTRLSDQVLPLKKFYLRSHIDSRTEKWKGNIHKPRGKLKGERASQMTNLLHEPYLGKVTTKGGGSGSNYPKI